MLQLFGLIWDTKRPIFLLKFGKIILSTNEPKCNCTGLNNNFLCLESSKSFIYHAGPNLILLEDPIFTKMENFASQKQAKSKLAHFCEVEYSINTLIKLIKYNMVLKENTFQICNGQALLLIFTIIQGDPNLNLLLQMTITLKICVFEAKWIWEVQYQYCFYFSAICL